MSGRLKVLASLAILITLFSFRFSDSGLQGDSLAFIAKQLLKIAIVLALFCGGRALLRLFRKHRPSSGSPSAEQAVLLKIKLSDNRFGEQQERTAIAALEDHIITALESAADNAQYDGNEYGEGFCTIYPYGSSADRIYSAITSVFREFSAPQGSFVVKRYGPTGANATAFSFRGEELVHSEVNV
jgi:hypothetical protein